jgi:2-iminobutanoate/2-iminopropanoate deaminase
LTTVISKWIKEAVSTDEAPAAVGPYSQAIAAGPLVFTSGQLGIVPGTKELAGESIEEQAKQVLENLAAILDAAGSSLEMVLKATVYLKDLALFSRFNEVYKDCCDEDPPAREISESPNLPLGALVEISVIALRD